MERRIAWGHWKCDVILCLKRFEARSVKNDLKGDLLGVINTR